eukprot:jgi/Mesen1/4109/ME000216S03363
MADKDEVELPKTEEPTTSTPRPEEEEGEEVPKGDDEDTGAAFAPIVKLEEVSVSSGEEFENVLFDIKSKLYRYDKDGSQWKERGVGQCKLLEHKESKKIRLLMRQQRTLKICANHMVLPGTVLQEHAGSDKSWVWHATDYADGELREELFAMRFGSIESAQKFKTAFEEAQDKMAEVLGTRGEDEEENASSAADALTALNVGGKGEEGDADDNEGEDEEEEGKKEAGEAAPAPSS